MIHWLRNRKKAQERLEKIVTRAHAIEISPGRFAVGYGPKGPLWGDDTSNIILLNARISE